MFISELGRKITGVWFTRKLVCKFLWYFRRVVNMMIIYFKCLNAIMFVFAGECTYFLPYIGSCYRGIQALSESFEGKSFCLLSFFVKKRVFFLYSIKRSVVLYLQYCLPADCLLSRNFFNSEFHQGTFRQEFLLTDSCIETFADERIIFWIWDVSTFIFEEDVNCRPKLRI